MAPLCFAAIAVVLAAPGAPPAQQQARRVIDDSYQRELPNSGEWDVGPDERNGKASGGNGKASRGPGVDNRRAAAPRRYSRRDAEGERGVGGGLGMVAQFLLWGVMVVGVALCLFWLARELTGYAGDAPATAEGEAEVGRREAPDRRVVERPLGDADELARLGKYGEAIHVLLLRTLEELARRLPERLPPSLTSREIVSRVRMPEDARGALSILVNAVEVSHFGAASPGEQDFFQCRHYFQRFAEAYMRGYA